MIKSMTGFGRCETVINNKHIIIEIKSVNSRFFDFSCRISKNYQYLEEKIKTYIQKHISRGKVDVVVFLESENDDTDLEVIENRPLINAYYSALLKMKSEYNIDEEISLSLITKIPDAFIIKKAPQDEDEIWECVKQATDTALEKFINMRNDEGERIKDDFNSRIKMIYKLLEKIEDKMPEVLSAYKHRLEAKVRELLNDRSVDEQRILTEVAIFADKVAIDEETVRIRSHLKEFKKMLELEMPIGRKLDFLLQEINREVNTIGSKVQQLEISHWVVDIKALLEKIREQVQNVE